MAERSWPTTAVMKIIEEVKVVSALSGPPLDDKSNFLEMKIAVDELAEAREEELRKLFDFGCFEEISLAYAKEHKVITTT